MLWTAAYCLFALIHCPHLLRSYFVLLPVSEVMNVVQGLVNGVSMSGVALVRSVTPVAGGAMWDWSVTMHFSLHSFVPFVIMACVSLGLGLLSTLPRELETPYPDLDGPADSTVAAAH